MFKIEIDKELHLELIHSSHIEETFMLIDKNRELFGKWLVWVADTKSIVDTKEFFDYALKEYANHKNINCMIFYKNQLVGNVGLLNIGKEYGCVKKGEIGYWLDANFHNKNIVRRAVKKMLEIGFYQYDLEKISLRCAVKNERSCNVAKKLGFTHEGRFRQELYINGVTMDADIYAILKGEFMK